MDVIASFKDREIAKVIDPSKYFLSFAPTILGSD